MSISRYAAAAIVLTLPGVAHASQRDALARAVFGATTRASAVTEIGEVRAAAEATLARTPGDGEALLTRALATGYLAKIQQSRGDAVAARRGFEALVARNPGDPETQLALAGWHLGAVQSLGTLMARAALGARKATGLAALDRAVSLDGRSALVTGIAGMLRLSLDPADRRGATLVRVAAAAPGGTPLDRVVQSRAARMVAALDHANAGVVQALAKRLLPLGQLGL